jgi:glutamate dehydrogenase
VSWERPSPHIIKPIIPIPTLLHPGRHVLKTNFYKPGKTALAFRLHPSFLDSSCYPDKPFGVFMIIGAEFRGFHIRFRDVARGGVRLVQSRYPQAYNQNVIGLFDECYNLVGGEWLWVVFIFSRTRPLSFS